MARNSDVQADQSLYLISITAIM